MTDKGALARLKPKTVAGQVRQLMPEIDRKSREGVSLDAICEALAEDGITIKPKTLTQYLYRWRKAASQKAGAAPQTAPVSETGTGRQAQAARVEHKDDESPEPETASDPETASHPSIDSLLKGAGSETGDFTDEFMQGKRRLLNTKRNPK